jgi:hypothetical protein
MIRSVPRLRQMRPAKLIGRICELLTAYELRELKSVNGPLEVAQHHC